MSLQSSMADDEDDMDGDHDTDSEADTEEWRFGGP